MNRYILFISQLYILDLIVIYIINKYPSFLLSLILFMKVGMNDGSEQTSTYTLL